LRGNRVQLFADVVAIKRKRRSKMLTAGERLSCIAVRLLQTAHAGTPSSCAAAKSRRAPRRSPTASIKRVRPSAQIKSPAEPGCKEILF
jgi:hypothetical protein